MQSWKWHMQQEVGSEVPKVTASRIWGVCKTRPEVSQEPGSEL